MNTRFVTTIPNLPKEGRTTVYKYRIVLAWRNQRNWISFSNDSQDRDGSRVSSQGWTLW